MVADSATLKVTFPTETCGVLEVDVISAEAIGFVSITGISSTVHAMKLAKASVISRAARSCWLASR